MLYLGHYCGKRMPHVILIPWYIYDVLGMTLNCIHAVLQILIILSIAKILGTNNLSMLIGLKAAYQSIHNTTLLAVAKQLFAGYSTFKFQLLTSYINHAWQILS